MIILYEFIDLMEVIRIKMVAFDAEVPFDRFSKELHFIGIGLGYFSLPDAKLDNRADPSA